MVPYPNGKRDLFPKNIYIYVRNSISHKTARNVLAVPPKQIQHGGNNYL